MDKNGPSPEAIRTLTYIGALTDKIKDAELAISAHVEYARGQGASWRMIGVALGISTQAAWERHNGLPKSTGIPDQEPLWTGPEPT